MAFLTSHIYYEATLHGYDHHDNHHDSHQCHPILPWSPKSHSEYITMRITIIIH